MRKRKPLPLIENVKVEDFAAEGKAIARIDGKVLFIPLAMPGDVVDVQVRRRRKSYMEGDIVAFHKYSPQREKPFCNHFGLCGGCKWQHIPYDLQLGLKQKQVEDQLVRIGKLDIPEISPIIGSKHTKGYRNKLEFTFSSSRWLTQEEIKSTQEVKQYPVLGFHVPGRFDKVFHVSHCHLQPEPSNAIRLAVSDFARERNMSFFNLREGHGFLRNLIIRTSSTGEVMVLLVVAEPNISDIEDILQHLKEKFPTVTSLMYVVNNKPNSTIYDLDVVTYAGNPFIRERMDGLEFRVGPKSFYQTNSEQAHELYKVAREFAGLTGKELVYDLYTGTGTIALFLAQNCSRIVGVESVPEAIDDAKLNAELNGIKNASFVVGDMKDIFSTAFFQEHGYPDVIVLDPPRAGIHPKVADKLKEAQPERIVYVSCNPASQARDLSLLVDAYEIVKIQPVDMFPQTHHVENVVLLEKRK